MRKAIVFLVCAVSCFALVATSAIAQSKFGLDDIPALKNKKALNIIIETGDAHGKTIPAIEEFTKKTGVKVNVERVASSGVYGKENVELMAGTGFYDLVYVETSWTTEWSDYLFPLKDLANKYDPQKEAGLAKDLAYMSPSILVCGQAYGDQMVLPFYTFDMCMWIRQDVYDNPTEQANYKKKYGEVLAAPTTVDQLHKQAADHRYSGVWKEQLHIVSLRLLAWQSHRSSSVRLLRTIKRVRNDASLEGHD